MISLGIMKIKFKMYYYRMFYILNLSSKYPHLNRTSNQISNCRKSETQLKANVSTIRSVTGIKSNRPDPPSLAHTSDHTGNTAAKSKNSSDTRGKLVWLVIEFRSVSTETTLEDKMISDGNALVDSQPVPDEVHEVRQHSFVVGVTRDGDGNVDTGSDDGVDEARDIASPASEHH